MGLFLQDKTNDTQWAVWKVEESLEALLALLPDARRVCCEQELLQFASEAYQGDTTWGGLLHWSAKETVFKCMKNADADLRKLCLSHFIPQKEGTFQVREYATEGQSLFSVGYRICEDFVLTWTSC